MRTRSSSDRLSRALSATCPESHPLGQLQHYRSLRIGTALQKVISLDSRFMVATLSMRFRDLCRVSKRCDAAPALEKAEAVTVCAQSLVASHTGVDSRATTEQPRSWNSLVLRAAGIWDRAASGKITGGGGGGAG